MENSLCSSSSSSSTEQQPCSFNYLSNIGMQHMQMRLMWGEVSSVTSSLTSFESYGSGSASKLLQHSAEGSASWLAHPLNGMITAFSFCPG
jgi:hypothetical protein